MCVHNNNNNNNNCACARACACVCVGCVEIREKERKCVRVSVCEKNAASEEKSASFDNSDRRRSMAAFGAVRLRCSASVDSDNWRHSIILFGSGDWHFSMTTFGIV